MIQVILNFSVLSKQFPAFTSHNAAKRIGSALVVYKLSYLTIHCQINPVPKFTSLSRSASLYVPQDFVHNFIDVRRPC